MHFFQGRVFLRLPHMFERAIPSPCMLHSVFGGWLIPDEEKITPEMLPTLKIH